MTINATITDDVVEATFTGGINIDIDTTTFLADLASTDVGKGASLVAGAAKTIATRSAMAALTSDADKARPLHLIEDGREGIFIFDSSDLSAEVAVDTSQGIYVAPSSDTDGSSGAWVRQFTGIAHVQWWGPAADGATADQAKINSALALDLVTELRLGASTYAIAAKIALPSNKVLSGYSRDMTTILALAGFEDSQTNPSMILADGASNVVVRDLTVNGNKRGLGGTSAQRCLGVSMFETTGYLIERVRSMNLTAYALWSNGGNDVINTPSSGDMIDVETLNSQIHIEHGSSINCLVENFTCYDGDGDIPCFSWLHVLQGSGYNNKPIIYRNGSAYGTSNAGADPQADGANDIGRVEYHNVHLETTGIGFSVATSQPSEIDLFVFRNCVFIGAQGGGVTRTCDIDAVGTKFIGGATGIEAHTTDAVFKDCLFEGSTDPGGASGAKGMAIFSTRTGGQDVLLRDGCKAIANGPLGEGLEIAIAGIALVDIGQSTTLVPPRTWSSATITNNANTTVTTLTGGWYKVEKTGGTADTYDAAAVTADAMATDFDVDIEVTELTTWVAGVSADPTASNGSSIDLGVSIDATGILYTGPSGSLTGKTMAKVGDVIRMKRRADRVRIYRNEELVSTHTLATSVKFDSSIYTSGGDFLARVSYDA